MRKRFYTLINNTVSSSIKVPIYLILFVSNSCRNRCLHCWYNPKDTRSANTNSELTLDEIEKISKSIKRLKFLSITGGEAFLRNDIVEIVKVFSSNTKIDRFDIPTSGFDEDLILGNTESILKVTDIPFRVNVSLDGLEETHNHIRQNKNAFQNAIRTIKALSKLKKRYKQFDLAVITTISEYNKDEVEKLADYIGKLTPDCEWMINIERTNEPNNTVSEELFSRYILLNEIVKRNSKGEKNNGDKGHKYGKLLTAKNELRREIICEILQGDRQGGGCSAGALIVVIFNDGSVYPCETLKESFGNLRDNNYNLPAIWNCNNAKKIRKQIQDTECLCTHECFLSTSILIQPASLYRLLGKIIR